jgi:adenylylsulfate kinase
MRDTSTPMVILWSSLRTPPAGPSSSVQPKTSHRSIIVRSRMPPTHNPMDHHGSVGRAEREELLRQRGCMIWLTGLSGSGKSTIARGLERRLYNGGRLTYVLDGDNVRQGLNSDLNFAAADRQENIRRIGEVAGLFVDAAVITVVAFISPFRIDRERVRQKVGADRFVEVFVDAPIAVCESRDPKGLYRRARAGEILEFTGISSPYEPPLSPDLTLRTADSGVDECVDNICGELERRGILPVPSIS